MFNSPILDIAIGLVFIFLLYSLLATSVKEAIATLFGLRARMLRKGIVERMLADSPRYGRWGNIWAAIVDFLQELQCMFTGSKEDTPKRLGYFFYQHPLIKNYGSNKIFPIPSYIPTSNFSTVLLDVLLQDFDSKLPLIAESKIAAASSNVQLQQITDNLRTIPDIEKVRLLLEYYTTAHLNAEAVFTPNKYIDKETLEILQMLLKNSMNDIAAFTKRLEDWFDDSMKRVSGWYKRQVQLILFLLGLVMAIVFNVDTLEIAGKLSTDKDARDKLVEMAVKAADKYKDDPRVKNMDTTVARNKEDSAKQHSNDSIFIAYQAKMDEAKKLLNEDIQGAGNLLAIGWGDYGKSIDSSNIIHKKFPGEYAILFDSFLLKRRAGYNTIDKVAYLKLDSLQKDSVKLLEIKNDSIIKGLTKTDTVKARDLALASLYNDKHWIQLKVGYVLCQAFRGRKFLGFLILGFAVCLGAPFWFDLLNKLVKLRGAGKKEDTSKQTSSSATDAPANSTQPVTVNINPTKTEEEAIG